MSEVPSELKYTSTHEWVRLEDDGSVTVGITDQAQSLLCEVVFVDLPEPGEVEAGVESGVVESVKAASDVYSPIAGDVIEVNEALRSTPELINQDPYGEGWLFRMQPTDEAELDELMDSEDYAEFIEKE